MPQILTHNPTTLSVGQTVWILKTTDTLTKLESDKIPRMNASHVFKPYPCRIIKITQFLKENNKQGTGGPRKRLFEYHLLPECSEEGAQPIYATHKEPIFHTLEDMNKWIREQLREWKKIANAHDKRKEDLNDIIYI